MPVAPLVTHDVTVTEQETASVEHMVHSTASGDDFVGHALSVVGFVDWKSAAFRQIGAKIEMDRGDGALSQIKGSELGPQISLRSSLDGYGVRELSFTLLGRNRNPMKFSATRSMRAVKMSGFRGVPSSGNYRTVFEGYVRDSDYEAFPPRAQIVAQDTSLAFASVRMFYNLEQGAQRSRESVLLEVCELHGIPVGSFDIPTDADGNRGGLVFKAISEGGDRTVLEWITEFVIPIGARPKWSGGRLNIIRLDPAYFEGASIRTLSAGQVRSVRITPPPTNTPNQAVFSSQIFSYTGPSGEITTVEDRTITGAYTPRVALVWQAQSTGVHFNITVPTEEKSVVARIITRTTRQGGTVISQTVEEYGWYAPLVARLKQTAAGAITHNDQAHAYQYPDGTWRTTEQERFILVRLSQKTRTFNDEGRLTQERLLTGRYWPSVGPRASINQTTAAEDPIAAMMTDDGVAWTRADGREAMEFEINTDSHFPQEDGRYAWIESAITSSGRTVYQPMGKPTAAYTGPLVYVFGPFDRKEYGRVAPGNLYGTTRRTFVAIDETQHRQDYLALPTGFFPDSFQLPRGSASTNSVIVAGPIPFVEQTTGSQASQSASHTDTNAVQVAMARGTELPDYFTNNFCESDGELRTAAREKIRELNHLVVTIEMCVGWDIEAGSFIKLNLPDVYHEDMNLIVWSSDSTFNGATGENSQTLVCRWYDAALSVN